MQSKDIEVGKDYALREWRHSQSERVTITAVNATYVETYKWGSTKTHRGVVVFTYASGSMKGREGFCRPVKIIHTWAQEQANRRQQREWADQGARRKQEIREERAALAFRLHEEMLQRGGKVETHYCYDDDNLAALINAGFESVPSPFGSRRDCVLASYSGVNDLMGEGKVDVKVVSALLGLSGAEVMDDEDDEN